MESPSTGSLPAGVPPDASGYALVGCADASQSAAATLASVLRYHGVPAGLDDVRALTRDAGDGFDLTWLLLASRLVGLDGLPLSGEYDQLPDVDRPNIVQLGRGGRTPRFAVLYEINFESVVVGDPASGRVLRLPREEFVAQWTGDCVSVTPRPEELSRTREQLARLRSPWIGLIEVLNFRRAGARKSLFVAAVAAVVAAVALNARGPSLARWIGLGGLGAAVLGAAWLALFGQSCRSCGAAARLAGAMPLDLIGAAFYTALFAAAVRASWTPFLAEALLWASGVHAVLLWHLWRERASCAGCVLTGGAAFTAAIGFSAASTGDGWLRVLGVLAGAVTILVVLPLSRQLALLLGDRDARRLARQVVELSDDAPGVVRVTVWKRPRCPVCLYYESILRPALMEEFGEAIALDEREAARRWLTVPLIVVSGTLTIVFKGLPPENDEGDRYQALSAAIRAAQDPQLGPLGRQTGGMLIVEQEAKR